MNTLYSLVLIFTNYLTFIGTEDDVSRRFEANDFFGDWMVDFLTFRTNEDSEFKTFVNDETARMKRESNRQFGLRALAAPDNEDYYDRGGDSDGEDYFEKREWSDVFRQAQGGKQTTIKLDHPDLVDIDGIGVHGKLVDQTKVNKEHRKKNDDKAKKTNQEERNERHENNKEESVETHEKKGERVRKKAKSKVSQVQTIKPSSKFDKKTTPMQRHAANSDIFQLFR